MTLRRKPDKMTQKQEQESLSNLKNEITAKEVIQAFIDGKTLTQYAKEKGISRPTLYSRLAKQEAQDIMLHEVRQLETQLQEWIQELHQSPSPANQRTAVQELGKIVKHVQDKVYPSLFRTETININLDLTNLQQEQQLHEETLARLPPQTYQHYWTTYNQVKKDWNLT